MSVLFVFYLLGIYEADSIGIQSEANKITVVIFTDAPGYKNSELTAPERIIIDFQNTVSYLPQEITSPYLPLVKIRTAQFQFTPAPITRVVLELAEKTTYSIFQTQERVKISLGESQNEEKLIESPKTAEEPKPTESPKDTESPKTTEEPATTEAPKSTEVLGTPKEIDNSDILSISNSPDQIIGVGDIILISAPMVEEIKEKEFFIGSSGKIFLPLTGEIQVLSLTTSQLESLISKALSPYVKEPIVFVSIKQSAKNKICISGEVTKPGVYRFIDGYTVGEAINLAGGATGYANLENIIIKREGTDSIINIKGAQEVLVNPFDVIQVQRLQDILVDGEVLRPGIFTPTGNKVKLSEVLSRPWGFTRNANFTKVKIISSNGEKTVNLKQVSDVELKPGDIVIILGKRNLLRDVFDFTLRTIPLVTFTLMVYWHYY